MRARVHVWIEGLVQGVFFRASTAQEARNAGVDGWVRNLPDGRVEAVFEGEPEAVDTVVAWCRHGPPFASVSRMDALEEPPEAETGFQVR